MTFLLHWKGIAEDLQVQRFATRAAAEGAGNASPNERSAWVIDQATDFKDVTGSTLVAIYNQWTSAPVKKFENRETAQRRVFMALTDKFGNLPVSDFVEDPAPSQPEPAAETAAAPTTEVQQPTMAKKKAPAPRKFEGYPAKAVADFSPMRDGQRAKILRLMNGQNTIAEIAKATKKSEALVKSHLYLMHTVHGIGCEISDSGKVKAVYPGSKTLKDAIKAKAEEAK